MTLWIVIINQHKNIFNATYAYLWSQKILLETISKTSIRSSHVSISTKTKYKMECCFLLNIVVRERSTIF